MMEIDIMGIRALAEKYAPNAVDLTDDEIISAWFGAVQITIDMNSFTEVKHVDLYQFICNLVCGQGGDCGRHPDQD